MDMNVLVVNDLQAVVRIGARVLPRGDRSPSLIDVDIRTVGRRV